MRDGDAERPVLSEMAEKLRRARSAGFHDFEQEPPAAGAPPAEAQPVQPAPRSEEPSASTPPVEEREAAGAAGSLQASLRLDSIERRLFDLRAMLDELAAEQSAVPVTAGADTASDAAAWIAFAAAAMQRSDDAGEQAELADQLLAEYRKRRAGGGALGERSTHDR